MANVDSEKPMLRGLTPPVLPHQTQRKDAAETAPVGQDENHSESAPEAFPGELTPVVTVDQSLKLAADIDLAERLSPPASLHDVQAAKAQDPSSEPSLEPSLELSSEPSDLLGPDDHTTISPTPIPPEADDHTNPTADAQILDATAVNPLVPSRAVALGLGNFAAKPEPATLKDRWLKLAQKPVALSGLQVAAFVAAGAFAGCLLTVAIWSPSPRALPQPAAAMAPATATPAAGPAKPRAAAKPSEAPQPAVAKTAAPPIERPGGATKPLVRKKPVKKFAKAARPGAPPKATR